ncbi:MAG: hypothetical protein EB020_03295 [Proteobacteria bacterium]|nr:hypothetical protein [Pseudomonadota bacterium]
MGTPLALALVTFVFGLSLGPKWLGFLQRRQFGKQLNPSEPAEHAHKAGTPTMGGIVFLVPGLTVISVYGLIARHWDVLIPVAVALAFGALGVVDGRHHNRHNMRDACRRHSGVPLVQCFPGTDVDGRCR